MMEFLEMLASRKAPEDHIRVSLVTVPDDGEVSRQREQLDSIVTAFDGTGIDFTWSYDGTNTAHGRDIVTDTGWKIVLDRGLDVFQYYSSNDAFDPANRLQEFRAVKKFYVTYIRQ